MREGFTRSWVAYGCGRHRARYSFDRLMPVGFLSPPLIAHGVNVLVPNDLARLIVDGLLDRSSRPHR